MKPLFFTFCCALCIFFCSSVLLAQTYYPMPTSAAQWRIKTTIGSQFPPIIRNDEYKIAGDTTIGAYTYHAIASNYNGTIKSVGYREQNQKIYAINFNHNDVLIFGERPTTTLGVAYLLMDFGAPVGTRFIRNQTDTLVVQSITDYNGRLQYNLQGYCLYENWVAGIGVVQQGCFEYGRACTDMTLNGSFVIGNTPFSIPNSICQASFTTTQSPTNSNFYNFVNTTQGNYNIGWRIYEPSNEYNPNYYNGTGSSFSFDMNSRSWPASGNPYNVGAPPSRAIVALTVWNNIGTCLSTVVDTVYADRTCTPNFTVNRINNDSFIVRNLNPVANTSYTWFAKPDFNNSALSTYIFSPLANGDYLARKNPGTSWTYPKYHDIGITATRGTCINTTTTLLLFNICAQDCFFAGDTNRDSIANNMDLLPIALNMGRAGAGKYDSEFSRCQDTYNNYWFWNAHTPQTWTTTTPNSTVNASFSDCDNSGTITAADTTIILRNYGFKNNRKTGVFQRPAPQNIATAPRLRCQFAADTLRNIQIPYRLDADIRIGDAAQTVPNLYGVAFSIGYDTTIAQRAAIDWDALAWLGTPAELLVLQKNNREGKIDVAIARNDHQPRTGAGKLAAVQFFIDDNNGGTLTNTTFQASITDLKAIDENGIDIDLNTSNSSVVLENMVLGANANRTESATIRLYPNPTYNRQFRYELSGGLQCSTIEITNLLGQTVFTKNNPENDILLPENLPTGLYSVVFYTNKGRVAQKIVVMQ